MDVTTPQPRRPLAPRAELERLAASYRHVLDEHRRAHPHSAVRRRTQRELEELSARFERVLARATADEAVRSGWLLHLHKGVPAPARPRPGAEHRVEARPPAPAAVPIEIVTRGPVGRRARRHLRDELARAVSRAPRPALFVRGGLVHGVNPSLAQPYEAWAAIDLGSRVIRASTAAASAIEAVDLLAARLRRELRDAHERDRERRGRTGIAEPGQWRHGDRPPPRQVPAAETVQRFREVVGKPRRPTGRNERGP